MSRPRGAPALDPFGDPAAALRAFEAHVVDAETYLPLAARYTHRNDRRKLIEIAVRYLVYERLPLNARTRTKLDLDPHPGAKCAQGADKIIGRGSLGFPNPCAR